MLKGSIQKRDVVNTAMNFRFPLKVKIHFFGYFNLFSGLRD